jgi:hypothetical protein
MDEVVAKLRPTGPSCPKKETTTQRNTYSSNVGNDVFKQWIHQALFINTPTNRNYPPLVGDRTIILINWSTLDLDQWSDMSLDQWSELEL